MKLEFLKDSKELTDFLKSCTVIATDDFDYSEEDDTFFYEILKAPDGKHYRLEKKVPRSAIKESSSIVSYRRNFKKDEPYVVNLIEVVPQTITFVTWVEKHDTNA